MPSHRPPRIMNAASEASVPSSRASWSGRLSIGSIAVPVKAYSAVVSKAGSALHQVHAGCGQHIEHRKTCPNHGEVANDQIVKAYSYGPGNDLMLTAPELARLASVDDETIRIDHLAPAAYVDLGLLSGRTLWLVPAHAPAVSDYALIVACLSRADNWAIGSVVFSERRQPVAIHAFDRRLMLHVLHWPAQRRSCPAFVQARDPLSGGEVRAFEKSLVKLRREFAWQEYTDESEQRLTELVREKLAARSSVPTINDTTSKGRRERKALAVVGAVKSRRSRAA